MKDITSPRPLSFGSTANQLLLGVIAVSVAAFAGFCLRHYSPGAFVRWLLVVLPVFAAGFYIASLLSWIRRLDELQRRIHLEASAFSLPALVLVAMLISSLPKAGVAASFGCEWESIAIALVGLYFIGLLIARRRYK